VTHPSAFSNLVHPIRIATPFAVGDVFSYLLTDDKIVLIDCGHHSPSAFETVRSNLADHGLQINDIDEIWLTHGHPDHFGQAGHIARESGAVVYGHPKERANFAGNADQQLFQDFFDSHHIPSHFSEKMVQQLDWLQQFQLPIEPRWIEDEQTLTSGRLTVKVKLTPGHAPGHLIFDTQEGLIFGGDLLLEHISTNALINFDPQTGRRNKGLLQYRKSLQWMAHRQGTVLPGHGDIIHNIAEVAHHHLQEHESRYQSIQRLLERQPMTLLEISRELFADAIDEGAIFLVLSEVLGYLDWGEREHTIRKESSAEAIIYHKI